MNEKITILGGGIIGLSCAYYLTKAGAKVTVIDRNKIGESCAHGNAGYITPSHFIPLSAPGMISQGLKWMFDRESPFYIKPRFDKALFSWLWKFSRYCNKAHVNKVKKCLVDLSMESLNLYQEMSDTFEQGFEFKKNGLYVLCNTSVFLNHELETLKEANSLGLDARYVSMEEFRQLYPDLKVEAIGAIFYPEDAHVQPAKLLAQLHRYLKQNETVFMENIEIDSFELEDNKVTKLKYGEKEHGVEQLLLASGSWSNELGKKLGLNLPIQAGKGYSVTSDKCWSIQTPVILGEARVAITPFEQQIRFGGTMEFSGMDLSINKSRINGLLKSVQQYFPKFEIKAEDKEKAWAGLRPCSPDGMPLIGKSKAYSNLIIATGHAMLGLTLAPVTGKIVSDIIEGHEHESLNFLDPERFR